MFGGRGDPIRPRESLGWQEASRHSRRRGGPGTLRAPVCLSVRGDRALGNIQRQGLPGGLTGRGNPLSHTRPPTEKEEQRLCVHS